MKRTGIGRKIMAALVCAGLAGNLLASAVWAAGITAEETKEIQKEWEGASSDGSAAGSEAARDEDARFASFEQGAQENSPEEDEPEAESSVTGTPNPRPDPSEEELQIIDGSGIVISREDMKESIKAGEEFSVVILIKNTYQKAKLKNVRLQLEMPQGISINADQKTDTMDVKDLSPGQERKVTVKLIAGKQKDEVPTLSMAAKLTYQYEEQGRLQSGKVEKNILIPVSGDGEQMEENADGGGEPSGGGYEDNGGGEAGGTGGTGNEKKTIDPMTPNIIISKYAYNKDVKAGQEFILKLEFLNTNKQTAIENLVMTVDAGEALSIEDSSNTTYVERMNPQEAYAKEIKLKVLPQGQAENAKLEINFKYEFLKKEERAQAASTEKLSIRFSQPDRLSIGDIQKEKETAVNEEASISIPYVNKGKTVIYNMEARLVTDMSSEETYKFLGNVEAGSSGTIDFFVTPQELGEQKVKVSVTYEDAEGNEKTVEKEAKLTVTEGEDEIPPEFAEGDGAAMGDTQVNRAGIAGGWAIIPAGAAAVGGILLFAHRQRKKKRILQEEEED